MEVVPGPDLVLVPGSARPGASKAGRVSGVANKAMTSRANKPTLEEQKIAGSFVTVVVTVVGFLLMCFFLGVLCENFSSGW